MAELRPDARDPSTVSVESLPGKALSRILFTAAGARSFGTGLTAVLLGLYLGQIGADAEALGLVVGAGLAGMAVGTAAAAFLGDRLGRRRALIVTALLSAGGLAGVAFSRSVMALAVVAFVGMVNGMGRDRGAAQVLEQSLLVDAVGDARRTRALARYTVVQDVCGALGALAAGFPWLLHRVVSTPPVEATRVMFLGAALVTIAPAIVYLRLPPDARLARRSARARWWHVPLSPVARKRVGGLAGLFALDSLGGGFLATTVLTYWFFHRFGLGGELLGPVFFAARALNAGSYLVADWLAGRIGLVRTMVFTHLPSSALLCALPVVPSAALAIALFLAREALVQMDVPTRQSYIAAVTAPGERTFALGVTSLVRNVGWATGPPLGGLAMAAFGLGAPLVIGASLKMVYDLALYASFRHLRPPEEVRA